VTPERKRALEARLQQLKAAAERLRQRDPKQGSETASARDRSLESDVDARAKHPAGDA